MSGHIKISFSNVLNGRSINCVLTQLLYLDIIFY